MRGALRAAGFRAPFTSTQPALHTTVSRSLAVACQQFDDETGSGNVTRSALPTPRFKALLLDAAGTLLSPSEPAAEVYLRYAKDYGCQLTEHEILHRFRRAYNTPWGESARRYVGDGRTFWQHIVKESTGCNDYLLSEDLYRYFAQPEAWTVAPRAVTTLKRLRDAGVKRAVVSNFDTRLRPLLAGLRLDSLFDAIVVSAEVDAEKPNPIIFEVACKALGVQPSEAVHVGDDRRNDVFGARDAGCYAWMWGLDVQSLEEVGNRILHGHEDDDAIRAMAL